jgi:hypothetical protein
MRTYLFLAIAMCAAPAAADVWLAGQAPTYSPTPHVRPLLGDRWSVSAFLGLGVMQVHGIVGSGPTINPTVTRTFDRVEVAADYLALDWNDTTDMRSDGTLHRLGGEVRYQAGRIRMQDKSTFDLVLTAGLGRQHLVQDHGASIDRGDASLGLVLRMLADMDDREKERAFFGTEMSFRLLLAPTAGDHADLGFAFSFGVPIGW